MKYAVLATICLLQALTSQAAVFTVDDNGPADYTQISQAILASPSGSTILVRPGTYNEQVNFLGKALTVTSENPDDPATVATTIITANTGRSVAFVAGEQSNSILTGFTILSRGIICVESSPTITKNVITDCTNEPILGSPNAQPTITGNLIANSSASGIRQCHGLISGNRIIGNFAPDGAGLFDCDGTITHNIIAGNLAEDSQNHGDGGGLHSCDGVIELNTIVENIARNNLVPTEHGFGGGMYECDAVIRNNIVASNIANKGGGLYSFAATPQNTYNIYSHNNSIEGTSVLGVGGAFRDPRFAAPGYWDDKSTVQTDDDVFVEGDYHVKSTTGRWSPTARIWVTDGLTSDCIDAGFSASDWSAELWPHGRNINVGVYAGTPQASMSPNLIGSIADFDHSARVDYNDLAIFASRWLSSDTPIAQDLTRNGTVDMHDFAAFLLHWRTMSAVPPEPSPMTWQQWPYATSTTTVAMTAATAASTDQTDVEYYFEDWYLPARNSGWMFFPPGQQPTWVAINLPANTWQWFRVKARNTGNLLETEWSEIGAVRTNPEDYTPPTPTPPTWAIAPHPTSGSSISMTATTAVDPSGVQYYFACTSNPAFNSTWQDNSTYEPTGLPSGVYTFTVRYRDKSPNQNVGGTSLPVTVDFEAPTPNPMQWEPGGAPKEVNRGGGFNDWWVEMTCVEADPPNDDVRYYFECYERDKVWPEGYSSGWRNSTYWEVKIGSRLQDFHFRVKAKDATGNETAWSEWYLAE